MKHLMVLLAAAISGAAETPEAIERELDSTARVASVMVDGDVCARIVAKRALDSILDTNPRDKWMASDN